MIGIVVLVLVLLAFYYGGKKTRQWSLPAVPRASQKNDFAHSSSLPPDEWYKTHVVFAKPYPQSNENHSHDVELLSRLERLQELPQTDGPQNPADWSFYKFVLENPKEQWLVQRQALKNIKGRLPAHSESDRSSLLSKIDKRALATWHMSDQELTQFLLGHHEH